MLLHRPVKLQHWGKHFLEIFLQKIYLITLSKTLTKTTHSQVVLFASLHKPLKRKVLLLYKGHWVLLLYRGYEKEICCYVKEQSRFNTNRKISLLSTFYRRDAWRGYGMWWWRGRRYRFMYLMNLFSFGCFCNTTERYNILLFIPYVSKPIAISMDSELHFEMISIREAFPFISELLSWENWKIIKNS